VKLREQLDFILGSQKITTCQLEKCKTNQPK